MKILLADSNFDFAADFAERIRGRGGDVRVAASAKECFETLDRFQPDVFVAARSLPAGGPGDLASLLAEGPLSSVPMILLVDDAAGIGSVAGDVVAVTLHRPVGPERLAAVCESVRRISRDAGPSLGRRPSASGRSAGAESGSFPFGE